MLLYLVLNLYAAVAQENLPPVFPGKYATARKLKVLNGPY